MDQAMAETAITKLKAAKVLADKAGKAVLLSGAANTAAKNISAKLQEMLTRLEGVSLADFDKAIAELERAGQGQSGVYRKAFNDYTTALTTLEQASTKQT